MEIASTVEIFIEKIISTDVGLENSELVDFLMANGNSQEDSVYVTLFTPIVLGRIICKDLPANFSDIYFARSQDGIESEGRLTQSSFYIQIYKAVENFVQNQSFYKEDIIKIAFRSPEFALVNDFMKQSADIGDLQFSPVHIIL